MARKSVEEYTFETVERRKGSEKLRGELWETTKEAFWEFAQKILKNILRMALNAIKEHPKLFERLAGELKIPRVLIEQMRKLDKIDEKLFKNEKAMRELAERTRQRVREVMEQGGRSPERGKEREGILAESQEKRKDLLKDVLTSEMASNGLNLVPFAGGGKMLVESLMGLELTGKKMDGRERIIHAAVGTGSLALDFAGVGVIGKGALIVGKSIGIVERMGVRLAERGATRSAKIFNETAEFMRRNPEVVRRMERTAEAYTKKNARKMKRYAQGEYREVREEEEEKKMRSAL